MQFAVIVVGSLEDIKAVRTTGFTQEILNRCGVVEVFDSFRKAGAYHGTFCDPNWFFIARWNGKGLELVQEKDCQGMVNAKWKVN